MPWLANPGWSDVGGKFALGNCSQDYVNDSKDGTADKRLFPSYSKYPSPPQPLLISDFMFLEGLKYTAKALSDRTPLLMPVDIDFEDPRTTLSRMTFEL